MAVEMARFLNADSAHWAQVLSLYPRVLQQKAEKKSKPQQRKELIELDAWFQEDLTRLIQERNKPHITYEELTKLVKWKLARGKFRPTLPGLVASNKPEDVVKASEKAFSKLPNLSAAIQALCVLRGIGPATASAVLAAGAPETAPFMSDESVLAMPGISVIRYDLNCYLEYARQIQHYTDKLKVEDGDFEWNPHKVELAVWTQTLATQLCPDLLGEVATKETASLSSTGAKHAAKRAGGESETAESGGRKAKRRK